MHCRQLQQQLDKGISLDADAFEHLSACELCQQYESDLRLVNVLRSYQPATLENETASRLIDNATATNRSRFSVLWSRQRVAAVAMLFVGLFIGLYINVPETSTPAAEQVVTVRQVNLVIESPEDMTDATISISLADNIELDGYPGTRNLSWKASLVKGNNLLALPLKLPEGQSSYMDVTYSDDHFSRSKRITFNASPLTGNEPGV